MSFFAALIEFTVGFLVDILAGFLLEFLLHRLGIGG